MVLEVKCERVGASVWSFIGQCPPDHDVGIVQEIIDHTSWYGRQHCSNGRMDTQSGKRVVYSHHKGCKITYLLLIVPDDHYHWSLCVGDLYQAAYSSADPYPIILERKDIPLTLTTNVLTSLLISAGMASAPFTTSTR